MTTPADRMQRIPPYFFASLGRRIAELRAGGMDVIRLDMGSPDLPPAQPIIDALIHSAQQPDAHGYTPFGGTPEFRRAVADHYGRRFGVELDPASQVVGLVGSKEGLFNLTQAMVNPGDVVLVPNPSYPVYPTAALFAGGEVVEMPLLEEHGYLPRFEDIPEEALHRAKLLWLNYPNNPTGATADQAFFQEAVALAAEYDILLCHDAPYTDVVFDGYRASSLLEVPGALDVAVEFNSLSKSYNMAGWRLGMAVGQAEAIEALYILKSQEDTSIFRPILDAGVVALDGDQSWLERRNGVYQERRDMVLEGWAEKGMVAQTPKAALYVWAHLPEGVDDSVAFCARMLDETGVSVTPGVAFGSAGEGYMRISLGTATERVREAVSRVQAWDFR